MQITLYSTATCPFCEMFRDYISEKGVAFNEKFIDQDEAAKEEMAASSGGFLGIPFAVILKDDGQKETVIGFDKKKINQILGITG